MMLVCKRCGGEIILDIVFVKLTRAIPPDPGKYWLSQKPTICTGAENRLALRCRVCSERAFVAEGVQSD